MNGYQHILLRQKEWAWNKGIDLIGSQVNRGRPMYAKSLNKNLFQPLLRDVRKSFEAGDGSELGSFPLPGKMQALHSSSALGVNIFQYWKSISGVPVIAEACGLCRRGSDVSFDIQFEEKYSINDSFGFHPNIDVVFHNKPDARIKRLPLSVNSLRRMGDINTLALNKNTWIV